MTKTTTYYFKLDLSPAQEQLAERYNELAPDYDNLSPDECREFDDITTVIFQPTQLLLTKDTAVICWLPVNGTVPPEKYKTYLTVDADGFIVSAAIDYRGQWADTLDNCIYPTHYAELPTTPHLEYWQHYTCDACRKPFTLEEWDARSTPHEPGCPNFGEDAQDWQHCTCDRNFHSSCYDADYQTVDEQAAAEARMLAPDRYSAVRQEPGYYESIQPDTY